MPAWPAPSPHRPGRPRAFSLVELLVALGVLTVLLLLLQQTLSQTSRAWVLGESSKTGMQNARAITDFMATEMQAALLPLNRASHDDLQFIVNPHQLGGDFLRRDAVFWQAPLAGNPSLGDVAALGYFVHWDTTQPAHPRPRLCRFYAAPAEGSTGAVANPDFRVYTHPQDWLNEGLLVSVAPADKAHGYRGLFAENVLGLWVNCLDARGQPITKSFRGTPFAGGRFNSREGYTDSEGGRSAGYTDSSGQDQPFCVLPAAVDFSLVILDAPLARRIGPAEMEAITQLAAQAADAGDFVQRARDTDALAPFYAGLRPYQCRVYLQNSP